MDEAARERLLERVYAADADLGELAEGLGVGLLELGRMASDGALVEAVNGLGALAELRSRLLVARYRVSAAARLVSLAGQEENGELARKAAVDLLKLECGSVVRVEDEAEVMDTEAVLRALGRLGESGGAGLEGIDESFG